MPPSIECLCTHIQLTTQSCWTLCDTVDYSLPCSSVNGIFPGKNTRSGLPIAYPRGNSWLRNSFPLSHLGSPYWVLTICQRLCAKHFPWLFHYLSQKPSVTRIWEVSSRYSSYFHFIDRTTDSENLGNLPQIRDFPGGPSGKEPSCQCKRCKRHKFNPWFRRSPGEGNGNPLQYSCLENLVDRGPWWAIVHAIRKESDMTETT